MITRERLIEWEHCYSDSDFENICGIIFKEKKELTAKEFLQLPVEIFNKTEDIFWVIFREGLCDDSILHQIAIWCAEKVLPLYESVYPHNTHPRNALMVKKMWLIGKATDAELDAARAAAWAAAWDARAAARAAAAEAAAWDAWDAARAAAETAWDAARAAAEAAARAAEAREAAWDAARAAAEAAMSGAVFNLELVTYVRSII